MDLHVIPECYIDTRLIKVLIPPQTKYNHQHGCSNVEKTMKEKLKGNFALGIIDKDKKILKYLNECHPICELNGFLQLLKHHTQNHYLILIRPAMERWILNTAQMASLSLTMFDLPDNIDKLRDLTKTAKADKDDPNAQKFADLFRAIKKRNPPAVAILVFWVSYLKANPYQADLNFLVEETARLSIVDS